MRAHQLLERQYTARMNGWTEFIPMQNLHNAVYREEEREMYPACTKFGMAGLPWSPVSIAFLTRLWRDLSDTARGNFQQMSFHGVLYTETDKRTNEKMEEIARARGVSMAIVAIAWSLSKPFVTAPIIVGS